MAPGDVFVTRDDIVSIAAYLQVSIQEFEEHNVRHYSSGKMALHEERNGDCIFLEKHGCGVYAVRPQQCRAYPFWTEIMESRDAWQREAQRCPGIAQGDLHAAAEIMQELANDAG